MFFHGLGCFGFHAATPDPSTGRTDTMSFASLCSIRPWGWTSVWTGFLFQILKGLGVGDRIRTGAFPPPVGNRRRKVINRNLGCPGKVIHNRRRLGRSGRAPFRRLMSNFGTGIRGAEEVKSAESAVSREEKRDATAVSRWPFLVLTVTFIRRKRSFPGRFAKDFLWQRFF
jgi:hypothetical protein